MNYLEAEDLTTGYGRQVISEALNCSFEAGTITSIIGPNGCGKSTLLKHLHVFCQLRKARCSLRTKNFNIFLQKK